MIKTFLILTITIFSFQLNGQNVFLNPIADSEIIEEGDCFLEKRETEKVIEKYTIVVELSPQNDIAVLKRAFAYLQIDEFEKSLIKYNTGIKMDSPNAENYSNKKLVKCYLKDWELAKEMGYEKANKLINENCKK